MNAATQPGLLAIDIGTSRVKLGWFAGDMNCLSGGVTSDLPISAPRLPEPTETFACRHRDVPPHDFTASLLLWLEEYAATKLKVVLASVSPGTTSHILEALSESGFSPPRVLDIHDLPIKSDLQEPTRVGIDRVLAALAVNRIRSADRPAIIISLGSACTVNFISKDGVFQGGAILPGLAMSAHALHAGTFSLPLIAVENLEIPEDGIGKHTTAAMSAGVYWGLVGGIEKLIREQSRSLDVGPQLFLTGGDAPLVVDALKASGHSMRLVPNLVLAGIAIACEERP
jgi:type III pantothenate kinase